jgi:cytochrome c-type biogenesis protein CcmE
LALTVIGLVVWAMGRPGAASFYLTTTELAARGPEPTTEHRVNGRVVPGSIERAGLTTTFVLSDGNTEIMVTTDRPVPDTFKERADVVARGTWDGRVLTASEVLAKCPSKFETSAS